jgi:hypothetical protein
MRKISIVGALALAMVLAISTVAWADGPTCGDTLGIDHHGQHVIGDYVVGDDGVGPTTGGENARGGVAIRGGPGPGFHFPNGFAPGASFCTNSKSPGIHL